MSPSYYCRTYFGVQSILENVGFLRQRIWLSDSELFSPLKAACLLYMHDFSSILADGPPNFYTSGHVSSDRCYSIFSLPLLRARELQTRKGGTSYGTVHGSSSLHR